MQKPRHVQAIPICSSYITNNILSSHAKNKDRFAAAQQKCMTFDFVLGLNTSI